MAKPKWTKAQERLWIHHNFQLLNKYNLQNKLKPYIVGADFSMTGTGLVAVDWDGKIVDSKDVGTGNDDGMTQKERVNLLKGEFETFIEKYPCSLFCYEKISVVSSKAVDLSMVQSQMFTTLCKMEESFKDPTYSVSAAIGTIKKGVSGSGASDKCIILKDILFKWGENINSDNIGDAYGAVRVGMAAVQIKDIYLKLLNKTDKDLGKFLLAFQSMKIDGQKKMIEDAGIEGPMFETVLSLFDCHLQTMENDNVAYHKTRKIIKAH
jgi:Holliday junction resolvasome RuvABC endonuclease subunit